MRARYAFILVTAAVSGCSLAFDADRYRYEDDAGRDAQAPSRDGGDHDAGFIDAGSSDAGPSDGGAPDAGPDAGPCGTVCHEPNPVCDPSTGTCVACLTDDHCDDRDPCTLDRCGIDLTCSSSVDVTCIGEISAGANHTCARRLSGQVLCWGSNGYGQLGNGRSGSSERSDVPVMVSFLSDAVSVSAGWDYSCAAESTGRARCWGQNNYGQLGDGTTDESSTPASVTDLTGATQVGANWGLHTCALVGSGRVACWGFNGAGQLGNADAGISSSVPVTATGITDALDVACGFSHTCAVRGTGEVACWGANNEGQLGNGGSAPSFVPAPVNGISDAVAVSMGGEFACALRATGEAVCWGKNDGGQLGNGKMVSSREPVPVKGLGDAVALSSGFDHTCALRSSGEVVCWGENFQGQLGDGTTVPSAVPVTVPGLVAVEVAAGRAHTCARSRTGDTLCWGSNEYGQLGDGTGTDRLVPTPVGGL